MKRFRLVMALAAATWLTSVHAQDTAGNVAPIRLPSSPPAAVQLPGSPAQSGGAENAATPAMPALTPEQPRTSSAVAAEARPELPQGPPAPVRANSAILRILDKVTAETFRFDAPIGRKVRYKSLIFMVKECETRDPNAPLPRPAAYVVVDSQPTAPPGQPTPPSREIFRGWMFAQAPGLHLFEHPVYDAWLDSCAVDTSLP